MYVSNNSKQLVPYDFLINHTVQNKLIIYKAPFT